MISEYQRLKNILLTNEQYTLFNIVNKPILSNFSNGEITLFDYNDDNNLEELEKNIQILNDDEDEASKKIMKFIEIYKIVKFHIMKKRKFINKYFEYKLHYI